MDLTGLACYLRNTYKFSFMSSTSTRKGTFLTEVVCLLESYFHPKLNYVKHSLQLLLSLIHLIIYS